MSATVNLLGTFWITQIYDFTGSTGIGFYWKGSGVVDGDQMVDFEMWSPTGGWVARFPDGEAEWRWVFLSWNEHLIEVGLDIQHADKTQIKQILWTYHSSGIRGLDGVHIWFSNDVKGVFTVRQPSSNNLQSEFRIRRTPSALDLQAEFRMDGQDFKDLSAEFEIDDMIDVYEIDGTTGSVSSPVSYTLIPEMTKTLVLAVGDIVKIDFEANFVITASSVGYVSLFADATPILYDAQLSNDSTSSTTTRRHQRSFHGVYVAASDETVVFTAQWKSSITPSPKLNISGNERKMIVTHIH